MSGSSSRESAATPRRQKPGGFQPINTLSSPKKLKPQKPSTGSTLPSSQEEAEWQYKEKALSNRHSPSALGVATSLFSHRSSPPQHKFLGANPSRHLEQQSGCLPGRDAGDGKMVREQNAPRSPGKPTPAFTDDLPLSIPKSLQTPEKPRPEFGKPSLPGAQPQPNLPQPNFKPAASRPPQNSIFNVPKANRPRPEHHRPPPRPAPSQAQAQPAAPTQPKPNGLADSRFAPRPAERRESTDSDDSDIVELTKPMGPSIWSSRPAARPMYSSKDYPGVFDKTSSTGGLLGNQAGKLGPGASSSQPSGPSKVSSEPVSASSYHSPWDDPNQLIDLTKASTFSDRFDGNAYQYVDPEKTSEDIKALLEGAFGEDDKIKTRSRRNKLQEKVDDLADKLKELNTESTEKEAPVEEEEEDDSVVEGLKVRLLPHQVEGVNWMLEKENGGKKIKGSLPKGGILADDMGLGKTIQSISLILLNPRPPKHKNTPEDKKKLSNDVAKTTLIVAPLALIKQWELEIKSKVEDSHSLKVCIHHGPQRTKFAEDLRKCDVVITTYQILTSEHGASSPQDDGPKVGCFGVQWYRVILDEAHTIKNSKAKMTKAAYALRSEFRWCLTGTPMQNNLDEIQSLIRFLRIKPYHDPAVWKDQITRPIMTGKGSIAIQRLQLYLKAFMKRRTKNILKEDGALNPGGKPTPAGEKVKDGGFQIVERKVKSVEAKFTPRERLFYDRLERRTDDRLEEMLGNSKLNYAGALTLLLRLRQACNHAHLVSKPRNDDKEALTTGQSQSSQPGAAVEADEMADLLGAMSIQNRNCDVCQKDLSLKERTAGMMRCPDCEADIKEQEEYEHIEKKQRKKKKKGKTKSKQKMQKAGKSPAEASTKRKDRTRRIIEDDSEEDDGEWIVPEDQRVLGDLGKAGGSEDENAEGGGEWINSEDSDTGGEDDEYEEDSMVVLDTKSKKKEVVSLDTTEDEKESSQEKRDEADEGSESDSEASDSDASSTSSSSAASASSAASLHTGRALLVSTKIRKLVEILRAETPQRKVIVFSVFTSMLDVIEPFLRRERFGYARYDGSMRNDAREQSLDALRRDRRTRVLLCSLKCGSLGLNLTAASRVVILEPFWNPFVEEQAIDRVHRLNQTDDVVVYKLTIAGTVEARILELQAKKRALAEAAIEGRGAAKLSMQDMLRLFKHDGDGGGAGGGASQGGGGGRVWGAGDAQISQADESARENSGPVRKGHSERERLKKKVNESQVYGRRW